MSNATQTDYMKSVRFTADLLARDISEGNVSSDMIADRLVTFASTVLDAARVESARDHGAE